MPNKTIYIREADQELWGKAEGLAGGSGSISALLTATLRRYVEDQELQERTGMENIAVDLRDHEENPYTVEFVGRWLLSPDPDETRTGESGYDAGAFFGVALTRRGNLAVVSEHCNGKWGPYLETHGSFDEAKEKGVPADILSMAATQVGADYAQKLDI